MTSKRDLIRRDLVYKIILAALAFVYSWQV